MYSKLKASSFSDLSTCKNYILQYRFYNKVYNYLIRGREQDEEDRLHEYHERRNISKIC
jgi:hypothetical protein